ncbi:CocE/NonD family hydrolase [Brenneria izbisi]|uniref:CocE/NonD family hydrolase n=1 Tax=Brenneria izbisi TaxID=2939450 RepID=A0AA41Y6D3_9GAMM|nr:CocE/NonD family hydrolase [Brenneria izbisi]MCV9880201.1 CocE/NonD family hydrolase [Brenneria izbisi]MCV9883523.1 CocE/NonD family hydrolase [Brenneria izbisi]
MLVRPILLNGDKTNMARLIMRIYGNDSCLVPFRKALPINAPRARYPGFQPKTTLLKAGSVRREGARPLPCDIIFERDVAVTLRDGTTMYTDVFRPATDGQYAGQQHPALTAWSPYGKEIGGQWLDDIRGRSGVPLAWVSELQKFEGPDPAFWCNEGYIVLNPDPRGAYKSAGNINYWGRQLAEDGYDFIEWAASQKWCSGKVGMAGNSWLAVSQWFIAAEQPPHLAAIAPWEGFVDHFRETGNRGGIPAPAFPEVIIRNLAGENMVEDQPRMIIEHQLMNEYWEDKKARLERIAIPAYVIASYTNHAHTHGSFAGFREILSEEKWLRVNNTHEWLDFYTPKYTQELLQFFNHYLQGEDNGWEKTPKVRICILDKENADVVDQKEQSWPPAGMQAVPLWLNTGNRLSDRAERAGTSVAYGVDREGKTEFHYVFPHDTDVIGYMKLRLWVEARGSDDMELAIGVEKRDSNGNPFIRVLGEGMSGPVIASGLLRVSHRAMDTQRSTDSEPYLLHTHEEKLKAGEIVPVEIGIWPVAMRYHAGEQLVLTIAAYQPIPTDIDMGFGVAEITLPAASETITPGEKVRMRTLGGRKEVPDFIGEQQVPTPESRNVGVHVIHFGHDYDSHLLVPIREVG